MNNVICRKYSKNINSNQPKMQNTMSGNVSKSPQIIY